MPNARRANIGVEADVMEQQRPGRDPAVNDTGQEVRIDVALLVRTIVAERFCRPLEEIRADTRLVVDLGLDSLDMIEVNIALEERLDVPLPQVASPDEISIETVQQLVDLVTARLAQHVGARAGV